VQDILNQNEQDRNIYILFFNNIHEVLGYFKSEKIDKKEISSNLDK